MRLGIDLGTSGVKVLAVDEGGTIQARASRDYPLRTPHPGWAEQDPDTWLEASAAATRDVVASLGHAEVRAIGLSGQMHTLVAADAGGRPTRPAISWADTRTTAQVRAFEGRVDRRTQRDVLGNPATTGFTALSAMWMQEHDPAAYALTRRIMLPKDYLRWDLTGEWATDPSDASATLLFDPFRRDWAHEVVEALGLDAWTLPPLAASDAVAGELRTDAARRFGLPAGLPVVTGAGDQAAAACGCGLRDPGTMLITLGSGGQVFMPLATPVADPKLRVHLFCHALPERWHLEGAVQNVGLALGWVRRTFAWSWEELYRRAARAPAGAEGATFLPYLTGERTPHMDPRARAAWSGLSLSHGPDHLARAALEGVSYAVAEAAHACLEAGGDVPEIVLTGGGATTPLTRRILADVLGRPLRRAEVADASAMGAAVLAGAPAPSLDSRVGEEPGPDADAHRAAYARMREAHGRLRHSRDVTQPARKS